MPETTPHSALPAPVLLACLCAAWCRTCDSYAAVFEAQAAALRAQGLAVQAHWIDIEEEAELLGEIDIETFPTLLVAAGNELRFAGVLTPQPETLARVLRAALAADAPALQIPAYAALAKRLRQHAPLHHAAKDRP